MTAPVGIVGAGPVGMTLALELARHGVPSVLVDRKPGLEAVGSRAIVLGRHTLETFVHLGCAGPMLDRAVALRRARTYFRDTELFCVEFPRPRPGEIPRFVNLQQTYTEAALYERVRESPLVEVRWETGVTGLWEDGGAVVLALHGPGGGEELRCAYAVGCDGAHSTVRKLLEVRFRGKSFPDRFLIADIRADLPFEDERRFFFDPPFNPGRQCLIHPQPDREWRIDWQVPLDTDAEAERREGRLEARIRRIIGDAPYELTWLTAYRFHQRLAERFRVGRVFLAGDAAHLVAPFGARGMNSGVEDARNLGWRLGMALSGQAGPALLDGYEPERQAAARENIRVTSATMRFMAPPTPVHRAVRNAVLRGSLPVRRLRRFVDSGRLAEPAVYPDLPVPLPQRPEPLARLAVRAAAAGARGLVGRPAPEAAGRLADHLGARFCALAFCDAAGERALEPLAERVTLVRVVEGGGDGVREAPPPARVRRLPDPDGRLARAYAVNGAPRLVLIRPDGYVAAELEGVEPAAVERALARAQGG